VKTSDSFYLVMNAGSSSLKYALFTKELERAFKGHVDGIGLERCVHKCEKECDEKLEEEFKADDHVHAVLKAMHSLKEHGVLEDFSQIVKVGHRVVHGAEKFTEPTVINDQVLEKLKSLSVLAPLHNPPAIAGILAVKKLLPETEQVAVFDTSFHHTIPKEAFLYGIPYELYEQHGIRKYGFHGISHEYVSRKAIEALGHRFKDESEVVTCHLGNGSSITAVKDGRSIDTSMGFTPLDGLIMGTRSGELDPEIILHLMRQEGYTTNQIEELLHKESGLKGLTGDSDVRELWARAQDKDERANLALDMLSYRIAKYIGSYAAALHGVDAVVFTGGIGENAYYIRRRACAYLKHLGVELDSHANRKNETFIQGDKSRVKVLVLETDEERAIAEKLSETA